LLPGHKHELFCFHCNNGYANLPDFRFYVGLFCLSCYFSLTVM